VVPRDRATARAHTEVVRPHTELRPQGRDRRAPKGTGPVKSEIMVPGHPRWCEFLDQLSRADRCVRTTEKSEAVLSAMRGFDVETSIRALRELGGTCDCAILFGLAEGELVRPA